MQITDILAQTGGIEPMARELGVSEADVTRGAEALGPALLGGFQKQVQSGGIGGLGGLLSQLGGGALLDNVLSPDRTDVSRGDGVLGEVFGSKDVSRTVAQSASAKSGLDPALLKRMLPILAMLVAGYLAKQNGASASGGNTGGGLGGGLGGVLGGILGGALGGQPGGASAAGSRGGLGAMLDADGNGNPLDDILRRAGRKPS